MFNHSFKSPVHNCHYHLWFEWQRTPAGLNEPREMKFNITDKREKNESEREICGVIKDDDEVEWGEKASTSSCEHTQKLMAKKNGNYTVMNGGVERGGTKKERKSFISYNSFTSSSPSLHFFAQFCEWIIQNINFNSGNHLVDRRVSERQTQNSSITFTVGLAVGVFSPRSFRARTVNDGGWVRSFS